MLEIYYKFQPIRWKLLILNFEPIFQIQHYTNGLREAIYVKIIISLWKYISFDLEQVALSYSFQY